MKMKISELGLKLLKEDAEDSQKKGELCPMKAELLLDLIELAERSFRFDREADWLAQSAANNGWYGVRVSPAFMREKAREDVERSQCKN